MAVTHPPGVGPLMNPRMNYLYKDKYETSCFIVLVILVISLWFFPSATPIFGIAILLVSLGVAILFIIKKHRKAYFDSKLTRTIFVRNVSLEIFGILIATILAGLAGRYLAQVVTAQITHELAKLIVSIMIGILAGVGIGLLVKKTWGRLVKA